VIRIERPDGEAMAAARAELARIETAELARVGAIVDEVERVRVGGAASMERRPNGKDIGTRYREIKPALARVQFGKCCYCEKFVESSQSDVEHFRPKARAKRGPGFPDDGYWWLAWHWDNLLFACVNCNRDGKGDHFPLHPASTCLAVGALPPGSEQPMLVDPLRESPVQFIQFRPGPPRPKPGLWLPVARNGDARGNETIRRLKLDRPELLDQYRRHVITTIMPELAKLRAAEGDARAFTYQWRSTLRALLSPSVHFNALSYDVLVEKASVERRRELGLRVPLPPYRP
jgi:uncharacterized protein (TIGR02646 family)